MTSSLSRRHFLRSSAAAGLGLSALGLGRARAASPNGKLRVLSIGVVGTQGTYDRTQVASHPEAEITGLCDVDSNYLAQAAKDHPKAFTRSKTELRTPFKDAVRITEATLLTVKATRFPGQELLWDKSKLAFTNHAEATKTIVHRDYRDGFAPPKVG